MGIYNLELRKLLQLFYGSGSERRALLRAIIRNEIKAARGISTSNGGDFHVPFWHDARQHVEGKADLEESTQLRIAADAKKARLYRILTDNFLFLLRDRLRWSNQPLQISTSTLSSRFPVPNVSGAIVRLTNGLHARIGDDIESYIYPYFSEHPSMDDEGGRLGLWAMSMGTNQFEFDQMHLVDLIGRRIFSGVNVRLAGDEETIFVNRYRSVIDQYARLREYY